MKVNLQKTSAVILLLLSAFLIHNSAFSQNVGISATGATPDNSAMLDVVSSNKGLLIPRVSLISTTDAVTITTPATSLMVYNLGTGGLAPAGYYYNSGTTGSPVWVQLNVGTSGTAWMLTGNAGTTASSAAIGSTVNNNFIGTTDAKDFVFATGNLERMRILSGGNIGIGTKNPQAIPKSGYAPAGLEVESSTNGTSWVQFGNSHTATVGDASGIALAPTGGGGYYAATIVALKVGTLADHANKLTFQTINAGSTENTNQLVLNSDGNVGIGTTNPYGTLNVRAGVDQNLIVASSAFWGGIDGVSIGSINNANTAYKNINFAAKDIIFNATGGSGNVGIGTTSPQGKLHVAGTTNVDALFESSQNPTGYSSNLWGMRLAAYYTQATSVTKEVSGIRFNLIDGTAATPSGEISFSTMLSGTLSRRMTIDRSGNVGIGCASPQYSLHVIGDIASSATIRGVNAYVTGAITACSDIRYKKDISPLPNALNNVMKLQGVNYHWKVKEFPEKNFTNDKQIGFIAQEIEKIYPEVVMTDKDGYKSVDYSRLTPVLVEAIKELKAENNNLKVTIQDTKAEVAELKALVNKLLQQNTITEAKK